MFQILYPIEWAVAWIMQLCHQGLLLLGFSDGPGPAWVLSIVGLVIIIRVALIPLFFKQINASRGMQLIQPEMQAIQKKYKNKKDPASREAMSRETMALYKKHGTNPFASCLPILLQMPIFFALFRVLNSLQPIAEGSQDALGPITQEVASDIERSTVFGAQLSDVFLQTDSIQAKIVIGCLILLMVGTTFFTQRQLTMKNMPPAALEGPAAQTQKMMLYLFPLIFLVSGVNFPVGVLVYWSTTNVWSMGQQYYTISRMPAPGSEAERRLKEKKAKKRIAKGLPPEEETPAVEEKPRGQRQQPKRKNRAAGPKPAASSQGAASEQAGSDATAEGSDDAGESAAEPASAPQSSSAPQKPNGQKPRTHKPGQKKPGQKKSGGSGNSSKKRKK
ncbi:YidC/Oxa1 family membrane protein insertase [Paraoerskovia marina]|uniref:Membrane protein insertase YidC n=1 Tax=Paraoerskovia marina TaxID=545619 RepID=A0A1H1N4S3_9CELL|nr:membrane protein insertase YidC [Paraoerskovia marina]SDR94053.1 YidC/Oxa1 family membrane protein insertase [Paraoerskovia marina]